VYDQEVGEALKKLWAIFGLMCGKYLAVLLRTHLPQREFLAELGLNGEAREKLRQISRATIDPATGWCEPRAIRNKAGKNT